MKAADLLKFALLPAAAAALAVPPAAHAAVTDLTGTIFVIVMENTNFAQIKGNTRRAPYINGLLGGEQTSYALNYNNPPRLHPSEPNYIWMEAGSNYGVTSDADPTNPANQITGKDHLTRQLDAIGTSWTSYQENISGLDCPLSSNYPYAPKHNPFVFFDDTTGGFDPGSQVCTAHNRPFGELVGALANHTVAKYVYITPNLCDDMHDRCAPLRDRIRQGDNWLSLVVPMITASDAYKNNGALFITWDEAALGDGPIGFIALSPLAKGHGYSNKIYYNHGSLLRTLEENMGVPILNDANNQADLADLFK